ncbi:FAD:protein FMN transferase [Microlunatus lacustris]
MTRYCHTTMGIPMSVDVRDSPLDAAATAAAVTSAFAHLDVDDHRFSPYRADSEISRINRGELPVTDASPELTEVLQIAARAREASGGAFDCHTPDGRLDTNGVVKGWSVQHASGLLVRAGLSDFCFNAGGDIIVAGHPEPGRNWQVGVRAPSANATPAASTTLAVLNVRDQAVATSGTYERGPHIWDGRAGTRPSQLVSVTVVADELTAADVLATTIMALGPDGVQWATATYRCAVLAVDRHGGWHTGGPLRRLLATP